MGHYVLQREQNDGDILSSELTDFTPFTSLSESVSGPTPPPLLFWTHCDSLSTNKWEGKLRGRRKLRNSCLPRYPALTALLVDLCLARPQPPGTI